MDSQKIAQTRKGIWIQGDSDVPLGYTTWLRERAENVVSFIPFEHPYEPMYLGSVGFLEIKDFPFWISRLKVDQGLLQNQFYPLGGTAQETRPELVGKGLARIIEFEIAQDLSRKLAEDTPIAIGATSDSHLEYCKRVGITPFKVITLKQYAKLLSR